MVALFLWRHLAIAERNELIITTTSHHGLKPESAVVDA
jgi:hypothetical protein